MEASFRGLQASNRRKTTLLLAAMFGIVGVAVYAAGTMLGYGASALLVPVAVAVAIVSVWISYWTSDRLVLAMTGARVVTSDDAPQLHNLVEEMCLASGLPKPRIAIVDDPAPNAFATGRNPDRAVIAYTTGILDVMDREQLQGVTAHELAHVANRDTLVMAVAATTAGLLAIVSDIGLRLSLFRSREANNPVVIIASLALLVLAPVAALLLKAAVSRNREALADATAVSYTRNPAGLRRALEELAADDTVVKARSNAVAHVWIESPLDRKGMSRMFASHPPIEQRIATLRLMEAQSS